MRQRAMANLVAHLLVAQLMVAHLLVALSRLTSESLPCLLQFLAPKF
jgi:hypothetical protein